DAQAQSAFIAAALIASGGATMLSFARARQAWRSRIAFEIAATATALLLFAPLALFAPAPRDLAGVLLVLFVAARLAPHARAGIAEHVVNAPAGPRLLQGYGFPLLLVPGWGLAGRVGVTLELALVAAAVSTVSFLILRDLFGDAPRVRMAWLLATALAPMLPL